VFALQRIGTPLLTLIAYAVEGAADSQILVQITEAMDRHLPAVIEQKQAEQQKKKVYAYHPFLSWRHLVLRGTGDSLFFLERTRVAAARAKACFDEEKDQDIIALLACAQRFFAYCMEQEAQVVGTGKLSLVTWFGVKALRLFQVKAEQVEVEADERLDYVAKVAAKYSSFVTAQHKWQLNLETLDSPAMAAASVWRSHGQYLDTIALQLEMYCGNHDAAAFATFFDHNVRGVRANNTGRYRHVYHINRKTSAYFVERGLLKIYASYLIRFLSESLFSENTHTQRYSAVDALAVRACRLCMQLFEERIVTVSQYIKGYTAEAPGNAEVAKNSDFAEVRAHLYARARNVELSAQTLIILAYGVTIRLYPLVEPTEGTVLMKALAWVHQQSFARLLNTQRLGNGTDTENLRFKLPAIQGALTYL
jgi:hypothetical protein